MKEKFLMVVAGLVAIPLFMWESAKDWFLGIGGEPDTDPEIDMNTEEPKEFESMGID